MKLSNYFSNFIVNEKKIIYLIFFLPISLLIGSSVANGIIILIIFLFLLEIFKNKKIDILKSKEFIIFLIFYIYLIMNSIFLTQTSDGLTRAIGFIRFPLLAFAIAYYFSVEEKKYQNRILSVWFFVFIIVSIDILFEYFIGFNLIGIKSTYSGRIASFTGDELKIGGFYFGFMLLAISFINNNFKKYNIAFLVFFLVVCLSIGERSNFIKVIIMTSFLFLFIDEKTILKKLSILGVLFLFFLIVINLSGNTTFKKRFFKQIYVENKDIKSLIHYNRHIAHYTTAIEIFKKNIFFGVGIKNFRNVSYKKEYFPYYNFVADREMHLNFIGGSTHPHQVHFEILSELGLVGYLYLFGVLIYFITRGLKTYIKKNENFLNLCSSLFIITSILPLLPSGSFFTSYSATIFWINFSFLLRKDSF